MPVAPSKTFLSAMNDPIITESLLYLFGCMFAAFVAGIILFCAVSADMVVFRIMLDYARRTTHEADHVA